MTVLDVLSLITDESKVVLFQDGEEVAVYDGKNCIPEEYNSYNVLSVASGYYQIDIEI